jgi:hypothetical protein
MRAARPVESANYHSGRQQKEKQQPRELKQFGGRLIAVAPNEESATRLGLDAETAESVAKLARLHRTADGSCGSVRHVKEDPVYLGIGWICSPKGIHEWKL